MRIDQTKETLFKKLTDGCGKYVELIGDTIPVDLIRALVQEEKEGLIRDFWKTRIAGLSYVECDTLLQILHDIEHGTPEETKETSVKIDAPRARIEPATKSKGKGRRTA